MVRWQKQVFIHTRLALARLSCNNYRAMLRRARYCYGKLSVRPSVRNVLYRDHISWNFSKLISPLVSLGSSLCADPTSRIYCKGNTLKF